MKIYVNLIGKYVNRPLCINNLFKNNCLKIHRKASAAYNRLVLIIYAIHMLMCPQINTFCTIMNIIPIHCRSMLIIFLKCCFAIRYFFISVENFKF